MKTAVAIRHVAFEDLGTFEPVLAAAGYTMRYLEAAGSELSAPGAAADADLLVILGGPIGAYEEQSYPFLADELRLLESRVAAGRPLLGICLGAQIIARGLGARVYPGSVKEIGWAPIRLTPEGSRSCLRPLGADVPVLHWHGDTFDLPGGATRLASSAHYENQAFAYGTAVLALQFHLEVEPARLERWFVGHSVEIAATPGIDVPGLRRDSRRHGPAVQAAAAKVLADWLNDGQA
ncbi:MAG TPA: glutamine amidotransferase [Rhodospirillales bacterium]|nr:glutamine amidotransferase [Rhodospirillales bacterium]